MGTVDSEMSLELDQLFVEETKGTKEFVEPTQDNGEEGDLLVSDPKAFDQFLWEVDANSRVSLV